MSWYNNMLRLAGLAALVGGAMLALASLQQFLNLASPDLLNMDRSIGGNNVVFARYVLQPFGVALLALGLVGLYARQARATGIPGLIGFLLAYFGTAIVYAGYWSILLAYLGWALFGVSSLKARVYPRLASVLLIVGALMGQLFNPTVAVGPGAAFGWVGALGTVIVTVVLTWLGFILFTERAEEAQLRAQTSPNLLRLAALAAVGGGVLVILLDLVQFAKLSRPDVGLIPYETSNVTITIIWVQQNLTYFGLAAVSLGLVGLYARQLEEAASLSRRAEILMLLGLVLASGGTLLQLHLEETHYWAVMLACLGWILFGFYSLRVRIYPRPALILLIASSFVQAFTNPIVIYRLVYFLGRILGEDVVGSDPSYYLYVGGGESTIIVYLGVLSEIGLYLAVAWLGISLLSEQGGAQAEQRRPERAADTRTFGGLWAAVLIVGLLPIVLLLIPSFREQSGLAGARASYSDDTNPACPPEDQAIEGVWGGSARLIVHDPCRHMVANVIDVEGPNADGDMDLWLAPDPGYTALVGSPQNVENGRRYRFGGSISAEPGPRDGRATDPDTGKAGPPHLPLPSEGDKVDLWGAYVFDSSHGYYEVHPIFSEYISSDGGNSWEGPYTSGPQYGGAPRITNYAGNPWTLCRDENNNPCWGYKATPSEPENKTVVTREATREVTAVKE
jgi:hypothetical protein